MSFRLNQLAVGNFFLFFTPRTNSELDEHLAKVVDRVQLDDEGKVFNFRCICLVKNTYGSDYFVKEMNFSTEQDKLRFSVINNFDADTWLERVNWDQKLAADITRKKLELEDKTNELQNYIRHFGSIDITKELKYDTQNVTGEGDRDEGLTSVFVCRKV